MPQSTVDALIKLDHSQVPIHLRRSIAYARGLMEESMDCLMFFFDADDTFRESIYLPMLLRLTLLLRVQFEARYGARGLKDAQTGFWGSHVRRELFHSQLDVVVNRCAGLDVSAGCKDIIQRDSTEGIHFAVPPALILHIGEVPGTHSVIVFKVQV